MDGCHIRILLPVSILTYRVCNYPHVTLHLPAKFHSWRPLQFCVIGTLWVNRVDKPTSFGYVSMPFGTLAICWHPGKILRRSSKGMHSVAGVNPRWVAEYSDFGPIERYISETVQDRSYTLVLISNRKSNMGSRLVLNLVTLDDTERRNSPNRRIILRNSVAFERIT